MKKTLNVISSGYLNGCNNTLSPIMDGYLNTCSVIKIPTQIKSIYQDRYGGGSGRQESPKGKTLYEKMRDSDEKRIKIYLEKIKREDKEVLNIIKIFLKCQ